jgi:hypothetical protein
LAHELEFINGKTQMAYAGQTPWHSLGTVVPSDLTPAQMCKAAGLDWEVRKHPLYANIDGQRVDTQAEALVRSTDNKVLSIVTESWNPVQNEEAFEFFNEFVQAGDMEMNTAGSLKQGKNVWALAKVKDSFEILGGDKVDSYLLFSNPHEYGRCIDIRFTPIRVVCNNTLTLSLAGKSDLMVRLNHRSKFDPNMVKQTLGIAQTKMSTYKEMAEFLGGVYNAKFGATTGRNSAVTTEGYVFRSGNNFITPRGIYTKTGNTYAGPASFTTQTGTLFFGNNPTTIQAGGAYFSEGESGFIVGPNCRNTSTWRSR